VLSRRDLAGLVLVMWIAAMGWQVRRVYLQPESARLAAAARGIPPGVAYYAILRGEESVGWAQTEVDTLPGASGFRVVERSTVRLPGFGPAGESETRMESWLDQTLSLRRFEAVEVRSGDTAWIDGVVAGDSLIRLSWTAAGQTRGTAIRLPGPVTTAAGWPLRLAASGAARAGDEYDVKVFDPIAWGLRTMRLIVFEQATRVFADSADLDSIAGRWYLAGEDTVSAWLVGDRGREGATWVDEDGRVIEGPVRGGLRKERTAFEIAFFGDAMVLTEDTVTAGQEQR